MADNLLIAQILLLSLSGCFNDNDDKQKTMIAFQEDIKKIESKIIDLTWPGGLFRYDEFKEIYNKAGQYKEQAIKALGSDDLTGQQKLIVALSMQKLSFREFLDFAGSVMDLFEQNKITTKVLHWCILPTYDWNTIMAEYYKKTKVNDLLLRLIGLEGLDEDFRSYVKTEVLTGKAKKNVKQLRKIGQIN